MSWQSGFPREWITKMWSVCDEVQVMQVRPIYDVNVLVVTDILSRENPDTVLN